MARSLLTLVKKVENQVQPLVETPPVAAVVEPSQSSRSSTHKSIETLVVVLAVIIIVGVIAGIIARLCGGRHYGGNGEHDIEGWVERKCRNCIDAGVADTAKPAAAEETKK
ncbi:hypothetical protein ACET3Z_023623 [Daucus carota]